VWKNPIAWREASGKRNTLGAIVGRWGFAAVGLTIGVGMILVYHFSKSMTFDALRQTAMTVVSTEIAIIALTAINISATAISREREDGSLDILLTTVGAFCGGIGYGLIVAAIHRAMLGPEGRSFDRTVRKLAGTA
jgi:hypothetical protein